MSSDHSYIRQAYIEPIRTVVLVDENFLTIDALCSRLIERRSKPETPSAAPVQGDNPSAARSDAAPGPDAVDASPAAQSEIAPDVLAPDAGEVRSLPGELGGAGQPLELESEQQLWNASRARKWTCDIVTDPDSTLEQLYAADLVVLDYHLRGGDNADDSLRIIEALSRSSRASLVIVYTNEERLEEAKRFVAARLRGSPIVDEEFEELMEEHSDVFRRDIVSGRMLDAFFCGALTADDLGAVAKLANLTDAGVARRLSAALCEEYLRTQYGVSLQTDRRSLRVSQDGASAIWIQCGNVFVTFVRKREHKGDAVFLQLDHALQAWDPPFLVASLAMARHLIAQGGFALDAAFLEQDEALHVGWLAHVLNPQLEPASEGGGRLRGLFSRALSQSHSKVLDRLAAEAESTLKPVAADILINRSRELAKTSLDCSHESVSLVLNAYMCSEEFAAGCLTTGTIFRRSNEDGIYWACMIPACDMVPKENKLKELGNLRAMTVLRLKKVPPTPKLLTNVTHLRHVFVREHDRSTIMLEAIATTGDSRTLLTETMYARNLARVKQGSFDAVWIREDALDQLLGQDRTAPAEPSAPDGLLRPSAPLELKMVVVAQLREAYASRLLQDAGGHNSRIGVDFVRLAK